MKTTICFKKGQRVGDTELCSLTELFPVEPVKVREKLGLTGLLVEAYQAYADFEVTIETKNTLPTSAKRGKK